MKRYRRLFICVTTGFAFVLVYLTAALLSKSVSPDFENKEGHRYAGREMEAYENGLDLSDTRTMSLLRSVESTNNDRIRRIEEVCRKYNLGIFKTSHNKTVEHPPVPHYSVFYFDPENKVTLCPIYKAGSTTWLFNLCLLSGMTEQQIFDSKVQLSVLARTIYPELEPVAAEEAFQKSIKIMTVRHPFERLLSAYRDKLENINFGREHGTLHFYRAFGRKIVKKYRKNGNKTKSWDLLEPSQYLWDPSHSKPAGIEPTFREFVKYLINLNLVHYADDHWIPYYLFCTPCLLHYDIIAQVETMDVDQLYSIYVLGLQGKIKPKWKHKTRFIQEKQTTKNSVSVIAKTYFKQLTTEEINKLYEKYRMDFEMFGYNHKEYLKYAFDFSQTGK